MDKHKAMSDERNAYETAEARKYPIAKKNYDAFWGKMTEKKNKNMEA